MMGNALVANADMENIGITLAPQYAKINIKNKAAGSETNGLFISSVQLKNVPESAYPFISAFTSFCWLSSIFLLSAAVTTETGNNVKANHNRMQQLSLVRHPCFTLQFIYQ